MLDKVPHCGSIQNCVEFEFKGEKMTAFREDTEVVIGGAAVAVGAAFTPVPNKFKVTTSSRGNTEVSKYEVGSKGVRRNEAARAWLEDAMLKHVWEQNQCTRDIDPSLVRRASVSRMRTSIAAFSENFIGTGVNKYFGLTLNFALTKRTYVVPPPCSNLFSGVIAFFLPASEVVRFAIPQYYTKNDFS